MEPKTTKIVVKRKNKDGIDIKYEYEYMYSFVKGVDGRTKVHESDLPARPYNSRRSMKYIKSKGKRRLRYPINDVPLKDE